ncbi:hypothetical protein C9374_004460 [Naegleria lovaniensis]|uniref:Guanylate cyclase domain-containing protein n=1 Tax=Naegleria lovaniensis TaxID=51637 RepID=A0AA88GRF4_NAELO|nr:uncharacterized protein C9374_004460 [Naegleria lovaniensis]KAG2383123.1 hypothetical protein C9374_004460 [Naegleria lovaniensis]
MSKVVPTPTQHDDELLSSSQHHHDDEESLLFKEKKKRPAILSCLLSVRLFLIVVITLVVLTTAVSIWLTSYLVNEQASLESVEILIQNINEKVHSFLNGQLVPAKQVADQVAYDYHYGYIDVADSIRNYLYSKLKVYEITLVNICFGNYGLNMLQTVTIGPVGQWVWAKKMPGENLLSWELDPNTGIITKPYVLNFTVYNVAKVDYYIESMSLLKDNPNGAFGNVYQVINSSMQTYWSTPVYNRTDLSTKQVIGIVKVNIALDLIAKFLASLKVLDRGYIVLSEFSNGYVLGSSLEIPGLQFKRINASSITARNAGEVMKQVMSQQNDQVQFTTTVAGVKYLVSSKPYTFYNIRWRMTLVFEDNEIKEAIITSSYIILGVTCGVALIGVIVSALIGYIVTNPFVKLQQDFKKIEVLDLINIKPRSSIFSEAKSIYSSLTDTVSWLSEFRAFLPDSVLNQLENSKAQNHLDTPQTSMKAVGDKKNKPSNDKKTDSEMGSHASSHSRSLMEETQSKLAESMLKRNQQANMFKLGLSFKECCVLNMTILNLNEQEFEDPEILNQTVSKVLTGISTICKTVRGDLQIKSYNEFSVIFADRPKVSLVGLDCSMKILTGIGHLNQQLQKQGLSTLKIGIGVSSGDSLLGNVGNKQLRYFTLIGSVVNRARDLCFLSQELDVPVVVDRATQKAGDDEYVFRPVERYLEGSKGISTVYGCLNRKRIENDEWLYELDKQNQNAKFKEYSEHFSKLFEKDDIKEDEIATTRDFLSISAAQMPSDKVIARLNRVIEAMNQERKQLSQAKLYHSKVRTVLNGFMENSNEPLLL